MHDAWCVFVSDALRLDNYFSEDIIKESEKLPHKIKTALKNRKILDKYNSNDISEISLLINESISTENNIKKINKIKENIHKYDNNLTIKFNPKEEGLTNF